MHLFKLCSFETSHGHNASVWFSGWPICTAKLSVSASFSIKHCERSSHPFSGSRKRGERWSVASSWAMSFFKNTTLSTSKSFSIFLHVSSSVSPVMLKSVPGYRHLNGPCFLGVPLRFGPLLCGCSSIIAKLCSRQCHVLWSISTKTPIVGRTGETFYLAIHHDRNHSICKISDNSHSHRLFCSLNKLQNIATMPMEGLWSRLGWKEMRYSNETGRMTREEEVRRCLRHARTAKSRDKYIYMPNNETYEPHYNLWGCSST